MQVAPGLKCNDQVQTDFESAKVVTLLLKTMLHKLQFFLTKHIATFDNHLKAFPIAFSGFNCQVHQAVIIWAA